MDILLAAFADFNSHYQSLLAQSSAAASRAELSDVAAAACAAQLETAQIELSSLRSIVASIEQSTITASVTAESIASIDEMYSSRIAALDAEKREAVKAADASSARAKAAEAVVLTHAKSLELMSAEVEGLKSALASARAEVDDAGSRLGKLSIVATAQADMLARIEARSKERKDASTFPPLPPVVTPQLHGIGIGAAIKNARGGLRHSGGAPVKAAAGAGGAFQRLPPPPPMLPGAATAPRTLASAAFYFTDSPL